MDAVTKQGQKAALKIKGQAKKSGNNRLKQQLQQQQKQQVIQLVANCLTKLFYLKCKIYFHYKNKSYNKVLLYNTWYIKIFQTYWEKLVKYPTDLQQEGWWK